MADKQSQTNTKTIAIGTLPNALRCYRFMAFTTGTVLLAGTIGLVWQYLVDPSGFGGIIGPLWIAHGYLFMVYLLVALNLGIHLQWHPVRIVLIMAAGTIPTMSFVAERVVMNRIHHR